MPQRQARCRSRLPLALFAITIGALLAARLGGRPNRTTTYWMATIRAALSANCREFLRGYFSPNVESLSSSLGWYTWPPLLVIGRPMAVWLWVRPERSVRGALVGHLLLRLPPAIVDMAAGVTVTACGGAVGLARAAPVRRRACHRCHAWLAAHPLPSVRYCSGGPCPATVANGPIGVGRLLYLLNCSGPS
jgi:hypothetical protein